MKEIFEDYYKADANVPKEASASAEKPKVDTSNDDMLS